MSKMTYFGRRINAIEENYFAQRRPTTVPVGDLEARVIYADTSAGLFGQYNHNKERIATLQEIVALRVEALGNLLHKVPEFDTVVATIEAGNIPDGFREWLMLGRANALYELDDPAYSVWKIRPTTACHMVRTNDTDSRDTVFFYTGEPFDAQTGKAAFSGEMSDGGVRYDQEALQTIVRETPSTSKMAYRDYLAARGGNFTGSELLDHPIFSTAIGDKELAEKYVYALEVLNLLDFYQAGKHSAWRPGEMKRGYGRPISVGYKGEAFYPPNNGTLDHCAVVLPRNLKTEYG